MCGSRLWSFLNDEGVAEEVEIGNATKKDENHTDVMEREA